MNCVRRGVGQHLIVDLSRLKLRLQGQSLGHLDQRPDFLDRRVRLVCVQVLDALHPVLVVGVEARGAFPDLAVPVARAVGRVEFFAEKRHRRLPSVS